MSPKIKVMYRFYFTTLLKKDSCKLASFTDDKEMGFYNSVVLFTHHYYFGENSFGIRCKTYLKNGADKL